MAIQKKDGEEIWFKIAGDPVADEDEVLWTVVDITQRVQTQNKIEQLASQLSKYLSLIAQSKYSQPFGQLCVARL